jgi:transcriptional regulator with GAF, ATPase, and Fis domain/pSer/pThr/pTyr-binding forkhead associated (FHA) protein
VAGVRLRLLGATPQEFVFADEAVVTIGRSPSNGIVVSDPRVSGLHARLVRRGEEWLFEDMGSTNGSLVRRGRSRDIVVDPRKTAQVVLQVGDEILLGDISQPVRLEVLEALRPPPRPRTSDIWRRSMRDAGELGTALVNNPLTSRKVLENLFHVFRELASVKARPVASERLLDFCLENFRGAALAGLCRLGEGRRLGVEALRTRGEAPRVPSGAVFHELFSPSLEEQASVVLEDVEALERAFGRLAAPLRSAMAAPVLRQGEVAGLFFVASPGQLTPFDLDLLTVVSHQASAIFDNLDLIERLSAAEARLRTENLYLREVLKREEVSVPIIGESMALQKVLRQSEMVARTDTTVLLLGETGTGKELFARYLHEAGARRDQLFAAINCGALAESLLESELFGHKKGAFTGAFADRQGLFQVADGGTLFLDEIGDVSPSLQVKLLRALESGEVLPVGATHPSRVNVRIIAATNKDLEREVAEGRFREDLYYRVNVFAVRLPPLRERAGDVPLLAQYFLRRFNEKLGKRIAGFSPACVERLRAWGWPGNIRELQNEIERAVLLSDDGQEVLPEALSERISGMVELPVEIGTLRDTMLRLEEQYILRALKEHSDNRTHTARTLGISRQALTVKLSRYGVTRGHD